MAVSKMGSKGNSHIQGLPKGDRPRQSYIITSGGLIDFRLKWSLTQRDAARFLACTQPQLSLWESGRRRPCLIRSQQLQWVIDQFGR